MLHNGYGDDHYTNYAERSIIADCLRDLGMHDLAKEALKEGQITKFVSIIQKSADKLQHTDVLERLYFAGLIYG